MTHCLWGQAMRAGRLITSMLLATGLSSPAIAATQPPIFDMQSYSVTVDVSPPGWQSFEIQGSAYDENFQEIVTIGYSGPSPWNYFSSIDGNPASFIFGGTQLGYDQIGLYTFGLWAEDNAISGSSVTGTTITVRIIPEPLASGLLAALFAPRRRRSHR